jgi:haloacetate dehalogenase
VHSDKADVAAFTGFTSADVSVHGVTIHARIKRHARVGAPAVLLLHGFPQTHVIWHELAGPLAEHYSVVCADLRGYGASDKPAGLEHSAAYSKRVMALDMVTLMAALGWARFHLVGHDRGARVAHRLALDHSLAVQTLCVLDISPTLTMYERTDMVFARAYFHWFMLIQPEPLPETLLSANPIGLLHAFLGGWGARGLAHYQPWALAEYERAFSPEAIHAMCEDYRAAAGIDLDHDRKSDADGTRVVCPTLVLWGEHGVVHRLFHPIADWTVKCALPVEGRALAAGHFLPEEVPTDVLAQLVPFLARHASDRN